MKKKTKILLASIVAAFVFTGCGGGSANVDLCRCLTEPGNSAYMRDNDDACRDAISKELGVDNWEKVNMSSNPSVSAKFDALVNRCQ